MAALFVPAAGAPKPVAAPGEAGGGFFAPSGGAKPALGARGSRGTRARGAPQAGRAARGMPAAPRAQQAANTWAWLIMRGLFLWAANPGFSGKGWLGPWASQRGRSWLRPLAERGPGESVGRHWGQGQARRRRGGHRARRSSARAACWGAAHWVRRAPVGVEVLLSAVGAARGAARGEAWGVRARRGRGAAGGAWGMRRRVRPWRVVSGHQRRGSAWDRGVCARLCLSDLGQDIVRAGLGACGCVRVRAWVHAEARRGCLAAAAAWAGGVLDHGGGWPPRQGEPRRDQATGLAAGAGERPQPRRGPRQGANARRARAPPAESGRRRAPGAVGGGKNQSGPPLSQWEGPWSQGLRGPTSRGARYAPGAGGAVPGRK
jgi:hypothetical protein